MTMKRLLLLILVLVTPWAHAETISAKLLLSSAWCSFSYNKTSGYSSTNRVTFNRNGSYVTGSRAEGGSSGPYGSMASQSDGGSDGRWKVVKGELYLSEGQGELGVVHTRINRNSNGYAVIVANGVEYAQCR